MSITVKDILGFVDGQGNILDEILVAVLKDRTFENHTKDIKLNFVSEKNVFKALREEKVYDFVRGLIDSSNKVEFLRTYIDDIYFGDLAALALKVAGGEGAWTLNDKAVKVVIGDVFDVQVKDIFGWINNKTKITSIVDEIFGERAIADFVSLVVALEKANNVEGIEVYAIG